MYTMCVVRLYLMNLCIIVDHALKLGVKWTYLEHLPSNTLLTYSASIDKLIAPKHVAQNLFIECSSNLFLDLWNRNGMLTNFYLWLHQKLSKWKFYVQPVTEMSYSRKLTFPFHWVKNWAAKGPILRISTRFHIIWRHVWWWPGTLLLT